MSLLSHAFGRSSVDSFLSSDAQLERNLTTKDLIGLGVGTVIGTGIFILPGHEAALHAGPAVSIVCIIAAIYSGISGMAFAEFSSAIPVAGSAYSFGSVIYGRFIGWLLGWALILEYFLAVAAIATGFSAYFKNLVQSCHLTLPDVFITGHVNIIAMLVILLTTLILSRGVKSSKKIENIAVVLKIAIIVLFIAVGIFFIKPTNYTHFYPQELRGGWYGLGGIGSAVISIIFAFLGFDALASNAAETKNPKKTMARGILGTVIISSTLYTLFALVLTGIVNYKYLNVDDPAAFALQTIHQTNFSILITVGALIGMFTAIFAMVYTSSRLTYAFARDGLLPRLFGNISSKHKLPMNALIFVTVVEMIFAGCVPLDTLVNLISAGTLTAFLFMNFGILFLRRRKDLPNTGFKVPGYPLLPILGGLLSLALLCCLNADTIRLFLVWIIVGSIWYIGYSVYRLHQASK